MSPYRITIVGAGLTGCITGCRLKKAFQDDIMVTILDKSRGAGGRMSTTRSPSNPQLTCDLGAQYISATPENQEKHKTFYNQLLTDGTLKEFSGKIVGPNRFGGNAKHYVAPSGINSVVKHFLKEADLIPMYQKTVDRVDVSSLSNGNCNLNFKEGGEPVISDAVVFTIPAPQLLQLKGDIQHHLKAQRPELESVVYSSRYALGLFYDNTSSIETDWDCNYVTDNECVRFIGIDNKKRGRGTDNGNSIVVHTSVPYGLKHLDESIENVESSIRSNLKKLLPFLPDPSATKCQRWRFSQVYKPFEGTPGCIVLNESPLIIAGGDSFSSSNFDGCIESSTSIFDCLSNHIKAKL